MQTAWQARAVNRLANETSPYLLQHADNPVDWYPWGEEALARARDEDRPILLSIGYAACHWCHVMEHESFEDASTAAVMNEHFVSVKVDREERPDLDAVYMEAVVALSGHGGWPMTVFLTPAGEPFFGGTYYPPEPRHGMPSFRQLLDSIAEAWRDRRDDVSRAAAQLVEAVRHSAELRPSNDPLTDSVLTAAEQNLAATFEPAYGGWGRAPKFPNAPALEFLLRREGEAARAMVVKTLDEMAAGGMYDLLGGGFHRYSVDDRWLVPHFEKMLYDNALLAAAYLHGWLVTGTDRYREIAGETVEYMLRELLLPGGGLASAQDADTDGVEGLTFTWTEEEGAPAELLEPFEHGRSIIRGDVDEATRVRLLTIREQRPKPLRDDKAIASWNGLALAALAEAGRRLDRPDWIEAARRLGDFLLGPLSGADGRLRRSFREGRTSGEGYLDDYANVAHGLIELHVATGELRWLREANRIARLAVELFADEDRGGFFLSPADGEQLVARTKELERHPAHDGAALDALAGAHVHARQVAVERLQVAPVVDDDRRAVAARIAAGEQHHAGRAHAHRRAVRRADVEARVPARAAAPRGFAPAEAGADRARDGPAARRRHVGDRGANRLPLGLPLDLRDRASSSLRAATPFDSTVMSASESVVSASCSSRKLSCASARAPSSERLIVASSSAARRAGV